MRTRSRRRRVVTVGGALVVLWALYVAWQLVAASADLTGGAKDLRAVRREATVDDLLEPATEDRLERAADRFDRADGRVSGILLAPVRIVPIAGRHLSAVDRLAEAGSEGSEAAIVALRSLRELEEQPRGGGPDRLALLGELAAVATDAQERLAAIDPGSGEGLVGALGNAVEDVREQQSEAEQGAARLASASDALATMLEGPTPYLLLGANNAEMRAGSGMFLSAAELRFGEGHVELGDVAPTADLIAPEGAVTVEGDLEANWGWLQPGRDLRQLGTSADFPQSAAVATQVWEALGNEPVGGVVAIDVDGLRSLLRVVGPVEVDGIRYSADTVRGELLRKQYDRFGDDRDARRDQLGDVAKVVFERLEAGEWELGALAAELSDAVAGRHLLVWSADPDVQAAWSDLGADGHLRQDSLAVSLVNRSANKLDSWVDAAVDVTTSSGSDGRRSIEVRYDLHNRSTGEGPAYVVGPNIEGIAAGDHRALVTVNLPAGTTDVEVEGAKRFLDGGDGPTVVVGAEVTIEAGGRATVVVRATLPEGLDRLVIEPSARIERTAWTVDGETFERDRRRTVRVGHD